MKKKIKQILSMVLTVVLLLSTVPVAFAADSEHGAVLENYSCSCCDLHCVFYEDYTLVVDGSNITAYNHSDKFEEFAEAKTVVFKENVLIDAETIFDVFFELEEFIVDENNPYYSAEDGVLYNKTKTSLTKYPNAKSIDGYVIPETVEVIATASFFNSKIESITIPANVEYIAKYAFAGSSIRSVNFENGERDLIIASESFYMCENLSTINLPAERVYCITSDSFAETSFYNNENNWENGALYLGKILLATNPEELTSDFTIKEGTTTLADRAYLIYFTDTDGEGRPSDPKAIKVTFPESVDNIGSLSAIDYDKLPEKIFRIATNGPQGFDGEYVEAYAAYQDEMEAKIKLVAEKYNGELTADAYREIIEVIDTPFEYFGWIHYASSYGTLVILDEGIKGIADDLFWKLYNFFGEFAQYAPVYYDGIILPTTFEQLSGYTTLCDEYVKLYIRSGDLELDEVELISSKKSITFLNKDTEIYDDPNTIWEGFTICGYENSTAHKYAVKYDRAFVNIENCAHGKTTKLYGYAATCEAEGYSGDTYCQYCGEFLSKGSVLGFSDHKYGEWEKTEWETCTKDGSEQRVCEVCDHVDTRTVPANGHVWYDNGYDVYRTYEATCTRDRTDIVLCHNCFFTTKEIVHENTALGHTDKVFDGYCDRCDQEMEAVGRCGCNCHKDGIIGFFYDFIIFLQSIFGINKQCSCGIYHY